MLKRFLKNFQKVMRNLRDDEMYRILFVCDCIGYGIVMLIMLWVFCSWHDVVNGTDWAPINIFKVFANLAEHLKH